MSSANNQNETNIRAGGGSVSGNKKGLKCDSCGSTEIDVDPSRADAVCTHCGNVLESSIIVSDIQFEENAHGGASAIGHFVSADVKGGGFSGSALGGIGGFGGNRGAVGIGSHLQSAGLGRSSTEITMRNARKKIGALAHQLSMRRDHVDMAFHIFKLAFARHLTRGRKSIHVVAACVYITCRTEGTSHMLIDLSDILQTNVYEIGRTYLRLSQALHINIPNMDPSLFVMRFAHKMELVDRTKVDKTHEVSMTALRLVSRMKKDWMHFGRRPSGLCGAALLIAARLHAFNRSVYDVIKVVKVHESTLRKRLNEFGETPASQLTLDEFTNVDLDAMTEEQDPPSFKAARRRDRERLLQLEDDGTDLEQELSELESKIEEELEKMRAKLGGRYAKYAKASNSPEKSENRITTGRNSQDVGIFQKSFDKKEVTSGDQVREDYDADEFIAEQTLSSISDFVSNVSGNEKDANVSQNKEQDKLLMPPPKVGSINFSAPLPIGLGLKDTIQEYLTPAATNHSDSSIPSHSYDGKIEEKIDVKNFAKISTNSLENEDEGEDLDLSGIDDEEIEGYIMSPEEIEYKTKMWLKVNAEYLKEKAEKEERERKEAEEAEKEGKDIKKRNIGGQGKKPRASKKTSSSGNNATAIEAIEKIVQEKKISTKINYDVLRSLTVPSSLNVNKEEVSDTTGQGDIESPGIFGESPIQTPDVRNSATRITPPTKNARNSFNSLEKKEGSMISTGQSSLSQKRPNSSMFPISKRNRTTSMEKDDQVDKTTNISAKGPNNHLDHREIVVETGPVDSTISNYENDEGEDDYEEEEDEMSQSAADLLSKHRGDDGAALSDYEEEYY